MCAAAESGWALAPRGEGGGHHHVHGEVLRLWAFFHDCKVFGDIAFALHKYLASEMQLTIR
jgi:hypothetical protein